MNKLILREHIKCLCCGTELGWYDLDSPEADEHRKHLLEQAWAFDWVRFKHVTTGRYAFICRSCNGLKFSPTTAYRLDCDPNEHDNWHPDTEL
jgi:hypothetical protein